MQALSPIQFHADPAGEPSFLDLDKEVNANEKAKAKAKGQTRCSSESCKKKLHLSDFSCGKCKTRFCSTHRLPESHACQHDFKKEGAILLAAQNPKVVGSTLNRI